MGISGLLPALGPPPRHSLAALASTHYTTHSRPLRLAIDISIWLFQIQSGRGGSNPALRTFYYRLLRLLTLSIHPLFVFDGPNKPLFKRHKKVGGPGVKVASVPEFLAKQLLKQFGFPWHVAPGEAEAECAMLQREGVVDAVLSEDVDTLMFGSGVTFRSWGDVDGMGGKAPTHVSVYREGETRERSKGIDKEGMILVALMSGGDYLPDGVPGCGIKLACDAARAGFGAELCALDLKRDKEGLRAWKERLGYELRTNESKFFTRRNVSLTLPDDFPNREVLGYYTHPCVSTPDKVARLRESLQWDQEIDFPALRSFAADAFDWRCVGGAKKFIKNLAPAMLIRELRLHGEGEGAGEGNLEAQEEREKAFVTAIHGKREHRSTDGELEYRISFVPAKLVPIDLSIEEEDDTFLPAGGLDADENEEEDFATIPSSTAASEDDTGETTSPTKKKRHFKPFDPSQPEKLWILRTWLQVGCPLLVEECEASFRDPKEFLKQRRKARAVANGANIHAKQPAKKKTTQKKTDGGQENALMRYAKVTKSVSFSGGGKGRGEGGREPLRETSSQGKEQGSREEGKGMEGKGMKGMGFKMPSTQIPSDLFRDEVDVEDECEVLDMQETPRPFAQFPTQKPAVEKPARKSATKVKSSTEQQRTPKRANKKRRSGSLSAASTPAGSQRTITSYYSPSPRRHQIRPEAEKEVAMRETDFINLISSSPSKPPSALRVQVRARTPTPANLRGRFVRSPEPPEARLDARLLGRADEVGQGDGWLPDTVTKRRHRARGAVKRVKTAPMFGLDDDEDGDAGGFLVGDAWDEGGTREVEAMDLASSSPLVSPSRLLGRATAAQSLRESLSVPPAPPPEYAPAQIDRIDEGSIRPATAPIHRNTDKPTSSRAAPLKSTRPVRRSPRQHSAPAPPSQQMQPKKKAILLRQSLVGAWKEVDAETLDLSGDGSGWKVSQGRAEIVGGVGYSAWRKSGVEVLDLTGA